MNALTLNLPAIFKFTDEHLEQLAAANRDLRLELTAKGELIIMPPTGGETGERNMDIEGQLWLWNRRSKLGRTFNSSTGFRLPNGATRSPDASWRVGKQQDENAPTPPIGNRKNGRDVPYRFANFMYRGILLLPLCN